MTPREQEETLARLLAGETLGAAESEALRHALEASDAAAAVDQVLLDRLLRHHFTNADATAFTAEVLARLSPAKEPTLQARVVRSLAWRRWRWAAAAAAAVLLAGVSWLMVSRFRAQAVIVADSGAKWSDGGVWKNGARLHTGDHLRLDGGFVSLRFASGAVVVIEGAADFEITGRNGATLHRGSAVARVPESAHGFTIGSSQGRIVDVGTEFAVRADAARMEVHVLKGAVEAYAAGREGRTDVTENSALRLDASGVAPITPEPDVFLTALPPVRGPAPAWLHWSFDEGRGQSTEAVGVGLPLEEARGVFASLPDGEVLPQWTTGVRGTGIELHGRDDYVQTSYPGISGGGPRTVACWVRVPQDFSREGYALVSWGAHQLPGDTWQLSVNPAPSEGPVGRLRLGTHAGHVVGTTDLRDGRWHHVASVLYDGSQPDVSTHVLLYVDGVLEPASRKTVRRVNTDTSGAFAQHVAFGKNSAIRSAVATHRDAHTFRGSLDEVTLCAAALSEEDIRAIMARGMPALP